MCQECPKWVDDVETTTEKHLNEFQPVVHCKRWKNNQNNKHQKVIMFIPIFIIGQMVYLNHVQSMYTCKF